MNRIFCTALLVALAQHATPAAAETVECLPIGSLPATLTTQGVYCLRKDLATSIASGAAITVAANNVTIDCNGFKVGGLLAGTGTNAAGILASGRLNTVVRNCNVRGFSVGINVQGASHTVEDNRLDNNTRMGIVAFGDGSLVRRNRVFSTGGGSASFFPYVGIHTADSVDVADNTVSGVYATAGSNQAAVGILTSGNLDGDVADNRVRDIVGAGSGASIGINNAQSGTVRVRDNQVVGTGGGIGLACANGSGLASGNHLLGWTTARVNCQNVDGNVAD